MIIEVVLMLFPFMAGLAVSGRRALEIIATMFALNVVLFAFAMTALQQQASVAAITTGSLSVTTFALGWLAGFKLPRLQGLGLGGMSLASGALFTAMLAGAVRPQVRHERVQLAMQVESGAQETWDSIKRFSSLPGERPLSMKLGMPTPQRCELETEAVGSALVCHFDEGRVEQRVTEWQPPVKLRTQITAAHLPVRLVGLTTVGTTLTAGLTQTYLLRTTEYDTHLAPEWFWGPLERKTVSDEQRYSLSGLKGHFVNLEESGVAVRLSVSTNPPTEITVIPPSGSGRQPLVLGRTPLEEQAGAFVGDTVLMKNGARGIQFEEVIEYGEPNELKRISKSFKESPKKLKGFPPDP